jgi:5-methylcytosine-specific restriction endonuclease McrA
LSPRVGRPISKGAPGRLSQASEEIQPQEASEIRWNIFNYLRGHPCVDCGEPDVIVLDFDHQRDKKHAISRLVCSNKSWGEILVEIEKCEIRCANCHRSKTARQFGWKKFYRQIDGLKEENQ